MIIPDSEVDCTDLFRAYFAGEKSLFSPPEESLYGANGVKSGEEPSEFDNVLGLPVAATGYFIMDSNNFNSNNMDLGKHGNEGQFDVLSGLWDDLKVFDGLSGGLDVDGLAPLGDGGDVDWSVYYQQDWNNFTAEYGQDYGGPQPASMSPFVLPGASQSAAGDGKIMPFSPRQWASWSRRSSRMAIMSSLDRSLVYLSWKMLKVWF